MCSHVVSLTIPHTGRGLLVIVTPGKSACTISLSVQRRTKSKRIFNLNMGQSGDGAYWYDLVSGMTFGVFCSIHVSGVRLEVPRFKPHGTS